MDSSGAIAANSVPQPQMNHDALYENLRSVLTKYHKMGVPGMDSVLHALNKAHVDLQGGKFSKQTLGSQPASPANPTPQGFYQP